MPAQQRLRPDEQAVAAPGREQSARRSKEGTITRSQPWALNLTAQDLELVAKQEQLDVLDLRWPAAANQQLQQGNEDEIKEGEEHRAMLPQPARNGRSTCTTVLAPFTLRGVARRIAASARLRACRATPARIGTKPDPGERHVRIPRGGGGTATTALALNASHPAGGHESANMHATSASGRAALGASRPDHPSRQSCSPTRWNADHVRRSGSGADKPTPCNRW
jgi:hypothetical protein